MTSTWTDHGTDAPKLRVLIAEDVADCANSTALLLRLVGHEVEIARTGPEALEKIRTFQPDVLLLDIGLPGMDGWKVASRLKDQSGIKKLFIVAVTGYGRDEDRQKSADSGIDLHLTKPVDPKYLEDLLHRFEVVLL